MNATPVPERRFLGMVEVDSGTLLLGDPMYCLPQAERHKPGIDYEAVIRASDELGAYLDGSPVLLLGHFGGDGSFPVYGEIDGYGELIRVTIEFVGPHDDAEETPTGS